MNCPAGIPPHLSLPGRSILAAVFVHDHHEWRTNRKFRGGTYVPSMHRKHSSDGRRSRIHGRNSSGVHRPVQKVFQSESSRSVSKNKGEIRWQQAKRETRNKGKGISR